MLSRLGSLFGALISKILFLCLTRLPQGRIVRQFIWEGAFAACDMKKIWVTNRDQVFVHYLAYFYNQLSCFRGIDNLSDKTTREWCLVVLEINVIRINLNFNTGQGHCPEKHTYPFFNESMISQRNSMVSVNRAFCSSSLFDYPFVLQKLKKRCITFYSLDDIPSSSSGKIPQRFVTATS